jgi:hypothetical protein
VNDSTTSTNEGQEADEKKSPKLRRNSPWYNLIACSPELSDGAKTLYQLLLFLWGVQIDEKGKSHERLNPGYRYISRILGCRQESIRRWLDQLVDSLWLEVATTKPRQNILKRYTLLNGFGKPLTNDHESKYPAFQLATKNRSSTATKKRSKKRRYGKAERNRYGKLNAPNNLIARLSSIVSEGGTKTKHCHAENFAGVLTP